METKNKLMVWCVCFFVLLLSCMNQLIFASSQDRILNLTFDVLLCSKQDKWICGIEENTEQLYEVVSEAGTVDSLGSILRSI